MPEMSSLTSALENGCISAEDLKIHKSLKSAVIPDDDRMKIKLKISKTEIADVGKTKKDLISVEKGERISGKSNCIKEDEIFEELDVKMSKICTGDPKMKLRSTKETEAESFESERTEEKKKTKESVNVKEDDDKPWKKRIKTIKYFGDEGYGKRDESGRKRSKRNESDLHEVEKTKEIVEDFTNINKESFCWTCHKPESVVKCDTCPRMFHLKCVSLSKDPSKDWICPECSLVLHSEKISTRSEAMKSVSLDQLCTLLSFAIDRMKNVPESQAFWKPVDPKEVPNYDKYITNPMDLNLLEKNMRAKMYGSPQAFLADAKWLLHNSIIFNSTQSSLTSTARFLVKICKQEMAEIENCPDCYLNAHTKDDWFIEVCRKPHILIWARLKGFPFWPAKAMSTNLKTQQVDARFFGAHDKAWVPVKECFLYSKNNPQILAKKRTDLDDAFLEAEGYIKKIRQKYGSFCYAPDKTPFVPEMYDKQLQSMIPSYKEEKFVKKRRRGDPYNNENGTEKTSHNGKKSDSDASATHKLRIKRSVLDEPAKIEGLSIVAVNDYVSEEKIANEDQVSLEDEIARGLEKFDTHKKVEGEALDENSTDLDEDESVHIPEHGYSRNVEVTGEVQTSANIVETVIENINASDNIKQMTCVNVDEKIKQLDEPQSTKIEDSFNVVQEKKEKCSIECVAENSNKNKSVEKMSEELVSNETRVEQCVVSSSSGDLKNSENTDSNGSMVNNCEKNLEVSVEETEFESSTKNQEFSSKEYIKPLKENPQSSDLSKVTEEKSYKALDNLLCDEEPKVNTEVKLISNIDGSIVRRKEKDLNEIGLSDPKKDVQESPEEKHPIIECLNVQCQNEKKSFEEISIKSEDFEQYLIEENNQEEIYSEEPPTLSPKCGSIKVKDFQSLSKRKSNSPNPIKSSESVLDITNTQSLKQTIKDSKMTRKRSIEVSLQTKKQQSDSLVKVIKLDSCDNAVEKLNRKLRLSDEVSLLMVDGEKKVNVSVECVEMETEKPLSNSKKQKLIRSKKSMPNKIKNLDLTKNINVISVNTENSTTQKNLLKSLCLEERKPEDSSKKTFLVTPNEKGGKNIDVKSTCESGSKNQLKEVTIEAVRDSGKGSEQNKEGSVPAQKNLAVVANSHLIVTNNGPTIVASQTNQPNLALAQNNLGQLSLVHLSNLTSGIQTNFINLTNETIGFNNSIGTLYATSGINAEFPNSNAGTGSLIFTPSSLLNSGNTKGGKINEKISGNRLGGNKQNTGISVKSPASLGVVTPSMIGTSENGVPIVGEIGSVTAELNKHSIKMAEYMRATIEDLLRELSNQGSIEAKYKLLTIEMEKLQWKHQQEIMELKHHSERSLMELRSSLESEKQKCLGELKAQLESQHQKVISETKRKQWCANCGKEALFYCCWNTSYCDYPCQQQHWPGHMSTCAQLGNNVTIGSTPTSQLQGKNPGMKYQNSSYVPVMSRGGSNNSGSHSGGPFAVNRPLPTVQSQSSHSRRTNDPSGPQLPVNITIRPHYYM